MPKFEEIEIKIRSGTISGLVSGPKDGIPILTAHGWLDNAASFTPLAKHLQDYRIVSIDLPGHGYSFHKPKSGYMHFVDYVPDLIFVLDELGWEKSILLGHSLGAAIISIIAGLAPDRVKALALIDAIGPYHASSYHLPDLMLQSINEYRTLDQKRTPEYDSIELAKKVRLAASPMKQESAQYLVERGLRLDSDNKYRWRTDPRLLVKSLIMFSEEQIDSFLKRITAPACLVRSTKGWPFTEESYHHRKTLIKNLEVHEIEGGHHVHMDEAKAVANIFDSFFKKLS